MSLALGANREGKEKIKRKASRIQSNRIGFAPVRVHRNAQHRELRLPESTRFVLITVVMVAAVRRWAQRLSGESSSPLVLKHAVTRKGPRKP